MDPNVVLFAIETGVRLGQRLNDALVEATHERPLLLPVGELFGAVIDSDAIEFFDRDENQSLVVPGGPYAGCARAQLITAYRTLCRVDAALGGQDLSAARAAILRLHALEQIRADADTPPVLQRAIGEVVNLGIDYFTANPSALGRASPARAIIQGLLRQLDGTDFASVPPAGLAAGLIGEVLTAALGSLQAAPTLLTDDVRLQALLGGVTRAVVDELAGDVSAGEQLRRHALVKRTLSAALHGGAAAMHANLTLFLPPGTLASPLVRTAFSQVLAGIRDHEALFPNDVVTRLFHTALAALGEHAAASSGHPWVQRLIADCAQAVLSERGRQVFDPSTLGAIADAALRTAAQYVATVVRDDTAMNPVFARALEAVAAGLSDQIVGAAAPRELLSKSQVVELARLVFDEVARDPERLLGTSDDPRRTVLAQVIGSVAHALADDPTALTGSGLLAMIRIALATGVQNASKLLDVAEPSVRDNPLYSMVQQIMSAVKTAPPGLGGEAMILELNRRLLPLASANIAALGARQARLAETITHAQALASGALDGRVNAANLPLLVEGLLRQVVWDELDLEDTAALTRAARLLLRAA